MKPSEAMRAYNAGLPPGSEPDGARTSTIDDIDMEEIVDRLRERGRAEAADALAQSRERAAEREEREAPGRHRRDVRVASVLVGFCVLQIADLVTTIRGLSLPGRVEGNPFAVPMLTLGPAGYVVKLSVAATLTRSIWRRREERGARLFGYALTAASLYAVVNNLYQIRGHGRGHR
jgi:hypothetical protein